MNRGQYSLWRERTGLFRRDEILIFGCSQALKKHLWTVLQDQKTFKVMRNDYD